MCWELAVKVAGEKQISAVGNCPSCWDPLRAWTTPRDVLSADSQLPEGKAAPRDRLSQPESPPLAGKEASGAARVWVQPRDPGIWGRLTMQDPQVVQVAPQKDARQCWISLIHSCIHPIT